MFRDAHGLEVTAESAAAMEAFDHTLTGYLSYRADTPQRLAALFEADPEFGLAHCLKGYFAMLAYKQAAVPMARSGRCGRAARLTGGDAARASASRGAAGAGSSGEPDRAAAIWEQILARTSARHPGVPAGAFRQFLAGAAGRRCSPRCTASSAALERGAARLQRDSRLPLLRATRNAATTPKPRKPRPCRHRPRPRRSVVGARRGACDGDAGPPRRGDCLDRRPARQLGGGRTICATSVVARGDVSYWNEASTDRMLALYDGEFRDLASPLMEAQPDLYIDVQNAASMLWRLRGMAWMSATAGPSWPTRRRRASATACPHSRCRTG